MAENFKKGKQKLIDMNGKTIHEFKEEIAEDITTPNRWRRKLRKLSKIFH
jgi:hypothetical protein